ncbi:phage tail fiber protein [Heliophilum fasciatum]|uniref:Uncharacterized protein n=1 Tax=Heliophilum fasciatum TaxID=35700 RepID=A0A4R2RI54_9FIRM|nr:hypothetical protein [Heliophilum fasciatum]MCW2278605.1 hypothetical protein [Heliophilum fasciatum]TCP62693.1 hypothetical protein EDD73_11941 [Heliophilum fasciatum]
MEQPICQVALYVENPVMSSTMDDQGLFAMNRSLEVQGGGYERPSVVFAVQKTGDGWMAQNQETILFPVAETDWGTITHMGILVEGDRGYCSPLLAPCVVEVGDQLEILPTELTLMIAKPTCQHCEEQRRRRLAAAGLEVEAAE